MRRIRQVTVVGAYGKANVGISTIRRARTPPAVSPRFPGQCHSSRGQTGPKPQPSGEGDGRNGQHSVTAGRSDVETEQWNLRAQTE